MGENGMSYLSSLIFYTVLIMVVCFCMHAAQSREERRWLWMAVLLLSLAAGLRAKSVGVDTHNYVLLLQRCATEGYDRITKEYLFYYIGTLLYQLSGNVAVPFTAYALLTNGLIFARLWDFRNRCSLAAATLFYCLYYYGGTMNGVRQYIAIAILFFATRYLFLGKFGWFYLLAMLACMFHYSACAGFALPVLTIGCKRRYPAREFLVLCTSAIVLLAAIPICLNAYGGYVDKASVGIGWITAARTMVFWAVCLLGLRPMALKERKERKYQGYTFCTTLFWICMVGFLCSYISQMSRIGYYFRFFELLVYGMVLRDRESQRLTRWLLGTALFVLGVHCFTSYNHIIPYGFCF